MLSTFFQRTIGAHLVFVGIAYLIFRYSGILEGRHPLSYIAWPMFLGGLFYFWQVICYRPVPRNPIQEFTINLSIAVYSVLVGCSFTIPWALQQQFDTERGGWPLHMYVYLFFAWGLIYMVDYTAVKDPMNRQKSAWRYAIFLRRRNG